MPDEKIESTPIQWADFKATLLKYRETGVPEVNLPESWIISDVLLHTFDELQVARTKEEQFQLEETIKQMMASDFEHAVSILNEIMVEYGRSIITDKDGVSFKVQNKNVGISERTIGGIRLTTRILKGEFAHIHNHPIDANPSSTDLISLLRGIHIATFIITPQRTIILVATDKTAIFKPKINGHNSHEISGMITTSYLQEMGERKQRILNFAPMINNLISSDDPEIDAIFAIVRKQMLEQVAKESGWVAEIEDITELNIAYYEAARGSRVAKRMR